MHLTMMALFENGTDIPKDKGVEDVHISVKENNMNIELNTSSDSETLMLKNDDENVICSNSSDSSDNQEKENYIQNGDIIKDKKEFNQNTNDVIDKEEQENITPENIKTHDDINDDEIKDTICLSVNSEECNKIISEVNISENIGEKDRSIDKEDVTQIDIPIENIITDSEEKVVVEEDDNEMEFVNKRDISGKTTLVVQNIPDQKVNHIDNGIENKQDIIKTNIRTTLSSTEKDLTTEQDFSKEDDITMTQSSTEKVLMINQDIVQKETVVHQDISDKDVAIEEDITENVNVAKKSLTEESLMTEQDNLEKEIAMVEDITDKDITIKHNVIESDIVFQQNITEKDLSKDQSCTEKDRSMDQSCTEKDLSLDQSTTEKDISVDQTTTEKDLSFNQGNTDKEIKACYNSSETVPFSAENQAIENISDAAHNDKADILNSVDLQTHNLDKQECSRSNEPESYSESVMIIEKEKCAEPTQEHDNQKEQDTTAKYADENPEICVENEKTVCDEANSEGKPKPDDHNSGDIQLAKEHNTDKDLIDSLEKHIDIVTDATEESSVTPCENVDSKINDSDFNLRGAMNIESDRIKVEVPETEHHTELDGKIIENILATSSGNKCSENGKNCEIIPKLEPIECTTAESIEDFIKNEVPVAEKIHKIEKMDVDETLSSQNIETMSSVVDTSAIADEVKQQAKVDAEKLSSSPKASNTVCSLKLNNNLDILSDDDEDSSTTTAKMDNDPLRTEEKKSGVPKSSPSQDSIKESNKEGPITIDDDDIMFIEEDSSSVKDTKTISSESDVKELDSVTDVNINLTASKEEKQAELQEKGPEPTEEKQLELPKTPEKEKKEEAKPLVPPKFLTACKKNLADMTRDDLEEFCILKIVESIVDRTNLSEIKTKLKSMAQSIDEHKKKAMMLTKQNRDLQVVLKSVQEEQRKHPGKDITPLKITRSVGMQILMTEVGNKRKSGPLSAQPLNNNNTMNKPTRSNTIKNHKPSNLLNNNQQIPVPRLIPANNSTKSPSASPAKMNNSVNVPKAPPAPPKPEKRSRSQSVTVDLTDDEPPMKITAKNSPAPVRCVPPQNLLAPRPGNQKEPPRKVYIPIGGPQAQPMKPLPGQTLMLKTVRPSDPANMMSGPRLKSSPNIVRIPNPSGFRMPRAQQNRHPAPLPDVMKQYQPPNWKALPPAPDLKLSKVENGIVISWKIEGYQEDSYEDISSYQLYAYQETNSPPSTSLWKKIGDVKALPLPMACTLTQFMAGYKYYFAVRAVDIRSRLGPFSLPGSILLLSKT